MTPWKHDQQVEQLMGAAGNSRVAVIGSGYVGTVVAACLASLGRDVTVVESDREKRELLERGVCPFYEPGLSELLVQTVAAGTLHFTENIAVGLDRGEVIFLCVGTPSGADGHADMAAVRAVATAIGFSIHSPRVIVTKSTVPIGSGPWLASVIEDAYDGRIPIDDLVSIVSCPEFLREGRAIHDFLHPERILVGSDDDSATERVVEVLQPILEQSFRGGVRDERPALVRTGLLTAETVKYASNAFLATKISFINELATICDLVGADISGVATAIGLDSRIGAQFLDAGVGWGGSCFGKDLSELIQTAADYGHEAPLFKAAVSVNTRQRRSVVDKLKARLKTLQGKRICLLGLAFKPGTDDLRDAPAIEIAGALIAAGASVCAHDPIVTGVAELPELRIVGNPIDAARRADAIVLVTEWPEYRTLDFTVLRHVMRGALLIDGRNALDPVAMADHGFVYEGFGRESTTVVPPFSEPAPAVIGPTRRLRVVTAP